MLTLTKLQLKVGLYSEKAHTGKHKTSQKTKYLSGHLSFLMIFFLFERKKVLDNTISYAVQRKCSLESGLQK